MSDDLISRQAAIDAIVNRETTTTKGTEYLDGYAKCQHDILDIIEQLPSEEPEGCPFYIENKHDRGDDSLCRLFHREVKCLAVETRRVGKWVYEGVRGRFPACRCSVCGNVENADWAIISGSVNYCPNCGAKMEGEGK